MERTDSSAPSLDKSSPPLEARLESDQVIFDFNLPELYKDMGSSIKRPESDTGIKTGTFKQIADSVDSWLPGAGTLLKGMGLGGDGQKTEVAEAGNTGEGSAVPEKTQQPESKPEAKKEKSPDAEILKRLATELKAEDPVAKLDQALDRLDGIDSLSVRKREGGGKGTYISWWPEHFRNDVGLGGVRGGGRRPARHPGR